MDRVASKHSVSPVPVPAFEQKVSGDLAGKVKLRSRVRSPGSIAKVLIRATAAQATSSFPPPSSTAVSFISYFGGHLLFMWVVSGRFAVDENSFPNNLKAVQRVLLTCLETGPKAGQEVKQVCMGG